NQNPNRGNITTITPQTETINPKMSPSVKNVSLPTWLVYAAGATGCVILIVCMAILVVACHKKRNKTNADGDTELNDLPEQSGRRGSAHESENSLYIPMTTDTSQHCTSTTTDTSQHRTSTHESENSLYGAIATDTAQNQSPIQFNFI
ncbi:unnamed protein product, partial [Meganyctiphanes norvegica]